MKSVDEKIEELKNRTKGKYITQACAFNKNSPRQMELLKFALENSDSFSGLVKEMLAKCFDGGGIHSRHGNEVVKYSSNVMQSDRQVKNVGNFI